MLGQGQISNKGAQCVALKSLNTLLLPLLLWYKLRAQFSSGVFALDAELELSCINLTSHINRHMVLGVGSLL